MGVDGGGVRRFVLDLLVLTLIVGCRQCGADEGSHAGHDHGGHAQVVTPHEIVEKFGYHGVINEEGLLQACPTLLSCQVRTLGCIPSSLHTRVLL